MIKQLRIQNIALIDAKKAIDMWSRVGVKILGVVENMSWMLSPSGEKIQLFPKGELDSYLEAKNLKKLSEIPFHPHVSMGSEAGVPIVESHSSSKEAQAFMKLAEEVRLILEQKTEQKNVSI